MPFNPKILRFASLPSTNTEAARLAQQGALEGVAVVAKEQTAGRGRLERQWASPAGSGLYFSIILRPRVDLSVWSLIPLLAALAVHDALVESCALKTEIKWPNDILFDDRKLCGILAETIETARGRAVILGIGINLNSAAFPEELREVAISIKDAIGKEIDQEAVLQSLVQALANRYELFQEVDGAAGIIQEWSKLSDYANGKQVSVRSAAETFDGITRGLESDGALRVETEAGEIRIVRAADVTSVRPGDQ
ncbi:MAG: biotin/acetyl-CoA-carboxylase ligase [Acidobacteria bacterium]|nr:biotin/acetyl-CoA-carboxylase ligase [Acidobacteriota bacterium]